MEGLGGVVSSLERLIDVMGGQGMWHGKFDTYCWPSGCYMG